MIDARIHLEKGDYSIGWIEWFIEYAVLREAAGHQRRRTYEQRKFMPSTV